MLNQLKVGTKLIGGFCLVAIILAITGAVGIWNTSSLSKDLETMAEDQIPGLEGIETIRGSQMGVLMGERGLLIPQIKGDTRQAQYKWIEERFNEIERGWKTYEASPRTPEEDQLWKKFVALYGDFKAADAKFVEAARERDRVAAQGGATAALDDHLFQLSMETRKQFLASQVEAEKILKLNIEGAVQLGKETKVRAARQMGIMTFAVILGFAAAILLGWLLARQIAGALSKITEAAKAIAKGDINQNVDYHSGDEIGTMADSFRDTIQYIQETAGVAESLSRNDLTARVSVRSEKDVLGKSFTLMIQNLSDVISRINESAVQVSAGAQQVSSASQSLSQGATEQASSIEEMSASMTEIGSQTKTNAENATQANQLARSAKESAEVGKGKITTTVESMKDINTSSQEISKIIKVIDDIAFQTNLLALNAAVEAARAGKHGKGFAVVADEVRNLAGRSAKAAKETAELIEGSTKKVENGLSVATQTAEAFEEIVGGIVKVADLVAEIAAASSEQAQGVSQVALGIQQIEQVTQQNTANAEETASAAEELSSQATELQHLLSLFKMNQHSSSAKPVLPDSSGSSKPRKSLPPPQAKKAVKPHASAPVAKAHEKARDKAHEEPKTAKWGGGAAAVVNKEPKPSEVIALDDKEFGKY